MTDSDKFKDAYHEALEAANRAEEAEAGKHEEALKRAELVFDAEPAQKVPVLGETKYVFGVENEVDPAVRKKSAAPAESTSDEPAPARAKKPPVPPPKKKKLPVPVVKEKEETDDDDDDDDNDDDRDDKHDRELSRFGGQYIDASEGFVKDYVNEVKAILFKPYDYFSAMPKSGGMVPPTLFLTVTAGIFSVLMALFSLKLEYLFMGFFGAFIQVFIASGIIYLSLKQMKGKGTFEGTYRVIAYSKATLLFAWIPWIGIANIHLFGVLAIAYGVYMNILGLERLHRLPRKLITLLVAIVALIGFIIKLNMGSGA